MHLKRDIIRAARLASTLNTRSNRVASSTLDIAIVRGARIDLLLESESLIIEQAYQELIWLGEPTDAKFFVTISPNNTDPTISATLFIGFDGIAIGQIDFRLLVDNVPTFVTPYESLVKPTQVGLGLLADDDGNTSQRARLKTLVNGVSKRYASAFISYSRKDFKEASLFAQGLSENNIHLFFDVSSMEPGDEWKTEIIQSIPKADTFYLMWSENAANSPVVLMEAETAVTAYNSTIPPRPYIKPITISRPVPNPPQYLQKFHFDSAWLSHRTAQEKPLFD